MNIPLRKTSGNLTREEIIIMVDGRFEGYAEIRDPRLEKQNADIAMPASSTGTLVGNVFVPTPISRGAIEIMNPKVIEARTSPRIMVLTSTGQEIILSSVLI